MEERHEEKEKDKYIEYRIMPQFWGWIIILLYTAAIIGFGYAVHRIVPDIPRYWSFGQLPITPAESVYSTHPAPPLPPGARVIPPLPGAKPLENAPFPSDWTKEGIETAKKARGHY